ncbi:class F sortase [Amnibacterium sp. CER49]|uniref:class F sortase n=1 Tax=Amnibacterium sp. CER49 TaxID=3039161 RepID=UPI00244C54F4|nr:class F sortase [Amnibacterium sp. CER49]MDH2442643.1 class F sortase [Amnibacterium sp. CER49]
MNTGERRRTGRILTGAAALAAAGGAVLLGFGLLGAAPSAPPGSSGIHAVHDTPSASAAPTTPAPVAATATPAPTPKVVALPRSVPTHLTIPAIGVDSSLMQLGRNADGTLEVPPYDKSAPPGWYRGSPTPGQVGPSVILGHVDTYKAGPVVFYRLAQLKPGDLVDVRRQDGRAAEFRVYRVENVPKKRFPTIDVYGDTAGPELRLITCGGDWDPQAHDYADNTVVFASLVTKG